MTDSVQFNEAVNAVLEAARRECVSVRCGQIGTEHMLVGLLGVEHCAAAGALASGGVSLAAVRLWAAELAGGGEPYQGGALARTPRADKTLELARREALQRGHAYVGTEHLLLGLIRQGECRAIQVLGRGGTDIEELGRMVSASLASKDGGPGPRDDPLPYGSPKSFSHYYAAYPASSAMARVFRLAADKSRQATITTMDLLVAIEAMDWANWQRFFIASAQPPREWSAQASDESVAAPVELWIGLDSCYLVSRAAFLAVRMADRLAVALDRREEGPDETVMVPGDLMYGMLSIPDCDAFRWITSSSGASGRELIELLGDRVFGSDLPSVSINDPLPEFGWKSRTGKNKGSPSWHESVQVAISHASDSTGVLSTLDFLSGARDAQSPAWRALSDARYRLEPPNGNARVESGEAESDVRLDKSRAKVKVTSQLAAAFATARSLAVFRGDDAVTDAHVLYGIFDAPANDGFRWLARPDPDPGPRQVIAERVFGGPLPPRRLLTHVPPAPRRRDKAIPVVITVIALTSSLVRFLFFVAVLGAIGFGIYAARPLIFPASTPDRLVRSESLVRASVSYHGVRLAATLVGRLSDYYTQSAVAKGPFATLDQWIGFATEVPPHAPAQGLARITYRGRTYPATLYCPGWLRHYLCLALARMPNVSLHVPGLVIPERFSWQPWIPPSGTAGIAPTTAYALARPRADAMAAVVQVTQVGDLLPGLPKYAAQPESGGQLALASPVVTDGGAPGLTLVGVATKEHFGQRVIVMPTQALVAYLDHLAQMQARLKPSAQPDAWLMFAAPSAEPAEGKGIRVTGVWIGRAADLADIEVGDRIVSVAGIGVSSPSGFQRVIARYRPYQTVTVVLYRGQEKLTCRMRLGYAGS